MKELPVSEARETLADVIEEANRTGDPIAMTRRGKRVAVLVDPAEYERLSSSLEDVLDRAMLKLVRDEDDFIPWEQAKQDLGLA
jgi:prevent-host-death family protein